MKKQTIQDRKLYHVKFWYIPSVACEIITVGAYNEGEAIFKAMLLFSKKYPNNPDIMVCLRSKGFVYSRHIVI